MKELKQIHETENYTYVFDALNGRVIATRKDHTAETYIYSDGSRKISFGGKSSDEAKKETNAAFEVIKGIVKEAYKAMKAEMFPNFDELEYHEKQAAQIEVRNACGYITSENARYERIGIMAAHGMAASEEARAQFDNM